MDLSSSPNAADHPVAHTAEDRDSVMRYSIEDRSCRPKWARMKDINLSKVGYYHVDDEDKFHLAEKDCFAKLKDRKDIQLPLDLNEGFSEERVDRPYLPSCIGYMMKWINTTKHDLKKIDVIMSTNLVMVSIGKTLIDHYKKNWCFECFMLDGKVYISSLSGSMSAEAEGQYILKKMLSTLEKLNPNFLKDNNGLINKDTLSQVNRANYLYFYDKYISQSESGHPLTSKGEEGEEEIFFIVKKGVKDESENEDESEDDEEKEICQAVLEAGPEMYKPLYYGVRFEDVLTTNNEGYNYSVITSKIAGYNILTRAEIDCSFNDEYVELKVGLDPRKEFDHFKFRKQKLGETWLQSYYGGIEKVVYGMRSYEGFINRFFTYFVDEIPDICKRDWSDVEMTSFIEDVFGWAMKENKEGFRTRVEYNGDDFIELSQTEYPEDVLPYWLQMEPPKV